MPLTFAEAYAIVCPDGGEAPPHSKEFSDILELMRQSGHIDFQDRLVKENVPKVPTNALEARPYIETATVPIAPLKLSKREWLSVAVNKEVYLKALNKK